MPGIFTHLYLYLKRFSFDSEGVYTPRTSQKKQIANTPSFVLKHLCTKSTKRTENDISAAATMKYGVSDDTNCMVFLYVAKVLILRLT